MQSLGHNIMTRIRTHSRSLESYSTTGVLAASSSAAMESSIMDPSDALVGTGGRDTVMADVGNTPIHHHHHHQRHHHPVTMALMNGVTITVRSNNNNNNNIADEDDDKCPTDKDGSDLRAIDFASATNHHSESQESVLDFDGSAVDDDNDGHGSGTMMMVDSMEVAEIAINSSNSNSSSGSSSSNSSSTSSNSSNSSSASSNSEKASNLRPQPAEVEGEVAATAAEEEEEQEDEEEEEDDDDEEEEDEDDVRGEDDGEDKQESPEVVATGGADESASVDKIMRTDVDPMLQETIDALMNGTGGIEVVKLEHTPTASAVSSIMTEMATERTVANDELETDRNYQCTYCGKLFTRSNTLSYHLKVHTGERPFKCKHCSKAFREQYRLMKHLKTHAKCRNRRMERAQEVQRVSNGREHLHRKASAPSLGHPMMGGNSLASAEEDCATGDSERFFKHYDLPDGSAAMKLEPDISLTEEGMPEVHDPDAMLTEEVEVMDEGQMACGMEETIGEPGTTLTADASDIRHQIIEERIKSLQREVHLVNQNLNRVESKVDGLTRIISLLVEKFEEDVDPAQRQATNGPQTIPAEDASIVPVTSLTVVAQQATPAAAIPAQPKTLLLSTTPAQQNSVNQQQATVYTHVTTVGQPAQLQQTIVPLKELRTGSTQYYQFTEPAIGHSKTTSAATATSAPTSGTVTPSPSPTPPPPPPQTTSSVQSQPFTMANSGGPTITGVMNGNQLLDAFPEIPELPIRTVGDFLDLNDHCTDNEQFLLQMMIRLHQEIHNSQPFQRNIKRMMEALVTYEVLCQFSWSGKSAINGQYTKYVFGNSLGIIDLLTKTLNLGKSAEEAEANQKPIFAAIQSFIKHSRQNMIRDSRKRRDPMRGGGGGAGDTGGGGGGIPPDVANSGGSITFHLNGSDRFQPKLIKSEHSELVNHQF